MQYAQNKKAYFNYEIGEKFEAGIELVGHEVKSVRAGRLSLDGSYVLVRGGEAFLVGATVAAYQPNNTPKEYDPVRLRKLLLTHREIGEIVGFEAHKGLTVVPLSVYSKGRVIKLELGVARGKKQHDKRGSIKKREVNREIGRTLKS